MSSLTLPAARATAGLLQTAEAAYAAAPGSETLTASSPYAHQGQRIGGAVTLTPGKSVPCTPVGNVTITDYGNCSTPVGNMTITDYGYCSTPVGNVTLCDYGHHQEYGRDYYDLGRYYHDSGHGHGDGRQLR